MPIYLRQISYAASLCLGCRRYVTLTCAKSKEDQETSVVAQDEK